MVAVAAGFYWHMGCECPDPYVASGEQLSCGEGTNGSWTLEWGLPEAEAHGGCPCGGIASIISGLQNFQSSLIMSRLTDWVAQNVIQGFFDRIYREAASLWSDMVGRVRVFGGVAVGDGTYAFIEDIVRAAIATVDEGAGGIPAYSIFAPYSDLPDGNDAFVYLGTAGSQTLYDIATQVIARAKSGEFRDVAKWLGENSPYAPSSLRIDSVPIDDLKRSIVRYTRMLVGDPLEMQEMMKHVDPVTGMVAVKEAVRINTQKRLAADLAAEAAADLEYALELEKELKRMEAAPDSASFTEAIKNLSRVVVLQTHVNAKLLKQAAHQNLAMAEVISRIGDERRAELIRMMSSGQRD
jgi:hypothetical protein